MKFAQNRMYIERYDKCPNCGILLFEKPVNPDSETVVFNGKLYCSKWCVEWEEQRSKRYNVRN
jgi:hypothetical protein